MSSSQKSMHMPSAASPFATNPLVKREGFDIPPVARRSPSAGRGGSSRSRERGSSTLASSVTAAPAFDLDDFNWNEHTATTSSFDHLHKYTNPAYGHQSSSTSSALDFQEALASLVAGGASGTGSHAGSGTGSPFAHPPPHLPPMSSAAHFAFSAPATASSFHLPTGGLVHHTPGGAGPGHNAFASSNNPFPSASQSMSIGLPHPHLLNHALDSPSLSAHSPSSTNAFSHPSSSFSFFDPATYFSSQHNHSLQYASNGPLSPATTSASLLSNYGVAGSMQQQTSGPHPSSVRSRSRSSVRNAPPPAASSGGGKAPSSRSRTARKGSTGAVPGDSPPSGSVGSGAAPASSTGRGRRLSSIVIPSASEFAGITGPMSSSLPAHSPFDGGAVANANGGSSWLFSPGSATGGDLPPAMDLGGAGAAAGGGGGVEQQATYSSPAGEGLKTVGEVGEMDVEDEEVDEVASKAAIADAKRRRRRESHNAVERRRRDTINEKISELATLLPACLLDPAGPASTAPPALGGLGERLGVEMRSAAAILEEEDEVDDDDGGAASKKKAAALKKKKASGGSNAIGPDGKPNKGVVLSKSVEYIRYLHQIIEAQTARTTDLERALSVLSPASAPSTASLPSTTSSTHDLPPHPLSVDQTSVSGPFDVEAFMLGSPGSQSPPDSQAASPFGAWHGQLAPGTTTATASGGSSEDGRARGRARERYQPPPPNGAGGDAWLGFGASAGAPTSVGVTDGQMKQLQLMQQHQAVQAAQARRASAAVNAVGMGTGMGSPTGGDRMEL